MPTLDVAQFITRTDNFAVLLHDPKTGKTAAIDAPEADPMIAALKERGWTLSHIFVTHKHFDHIEGIPALQAAYDCEVVGPEASAAETGMYDRTVKDGDRFEWSGRTVHVIETPGHTIGHIVYWFDEENLLFAGDTLFSLGCGRVMEAPMPVMWNSLEKLAELPGETRVYCGHEYTLANGKFALTVDPTNEMLKQHLAKMETARAEGKFTLPSTIGLELAINPFLRADEQDVRAAVGMPDADPADVFAEVRERKNRF